MGGFAERKEKGRSYAIIIPQNKRNHLKLRSVQQCLKPLSMRGRREATSQLHSLNVGILHLGPLSVQDHGVTEVWAEECHAFLMPCLQEES